MTCRPSSLKAVHPSAVRARRSGGAPPPWFKPKVGQQHGMAAGPIASLPRPGTVFRKRPDERDTRCLRKSCCLERRSRLPRRSARAHLLRRCRLSKRWAEGVSSPRPAYRFHNEVPRSDPSRTRIPDREPGSGWRPGTSGPPGPAPRSGRHVDRRKGRRCRTPTWSTSQAASLNAGRPFCRRDSISWRAVRPTSGV